MKWIYPHADLCVAVSQGVAEDAIMTSGVVAQRIVTIGNPVNFDKLVCYGASPPQLELPQRFHVAVGRLVNAKGYETLLDAYAMLDDAPPLVILGDGPERDRFIQRAKSLQIGHRVNFAGYVANPAAIVARAELFVSASLNEGFPNAMAEAMALATPVVVTNCPSGPAELLQKETVDLDDARIYDTGLGLLVPTRNSRLLSDAIRQMMASPERRIEAANKAQESIRVYSSRNSVDEYWRMIDEVSRASSLAGSYLE